ncbi:hypothetical protein [Sphingorhabdus sp.]|jgi:hypothetical protein|uniref:hypothetical protein n=1 Tax=Sphingorhabdus sp. TaxID=1902408 RepID=UPI0037C696EA
MPDTLRELIEAEKSIVEPTDWGRVNRCLELKLPLSIHGLVEEQFFFRATAIAHLPDQNVTFQLEYHGIRIPGGTGPLCRLEWNPRKIHNNKGKGPPDLRFLDQHGSHFHSFQDNWNETDGALLRDNLPVARPLSQNIQGFRDCLEVVGNRFRINNINVVKTPEWVLDLGSLWTDY